MSGSMESIAEPTYQVAMNDDVPSEHLKKTYEHFMKKMITRLNSQTEYMKVSRNINDLKIKKGRNLFKEIFFFQFSQDESRSSIILRN